MNDETPEVAPETQKLDELMRRLQQETAAEDVPPRIRALAEDLQRALDARAIAARAQADPKHAADKTPG